MVPTENHQESFLFSHSTLLYLTKEKKILEKNRMRNCDFTRSSNLRQVEVMRYLINISSGDLTVYQCSITLNSNIFERQIYISLPPPSFTLHVTVLSQSILRIVRKRKGMCSFFASQWSIIVLTLQMSHLFGSRFTVHLLVLLRN